MRLVERRVEAQMGGWEAIRDASSLLSLDKKRAQMFVFKSVCWKPILPPGYVWVCVCACGCHIVRGVIERIHLWVSYTLSFTVKSLWLVCGRKSSLDDFLPPFIFILLVKVALWIDMLYIGCSLTILHHFRTGSCSLHSVSHSHQAWNIFIFLFFLYE